MITLLNVSFAVKKATMPRMLIVTVLLALTGPAFAAGQYPPARTPAHPASSAHANAVAGQTGAARIEACAAATHTLIGNLGKGDYKAATADFDATMQAKLGSEKLGEVWKNVGSQTGKLKSLGTAQNAMYQGYTVIILPLHFQKADLNAQVACDAGGKIAGFFLRPATTL